MTPQDARPGWRSPDGRERAHGELWAPAGGRAVGGPVRFVHAATVVAGRPRDPLTRRRLEIVRRLLLGLEVGAPMTLGGAPAHDLAAAALGDAPYQQWTGLEAGHPQYDALLRGGEGVFFAAGTTLVVNHTTEGALELDEHVLRPREWRHDCVGETCEMCLFAAKR